MEVLLLKNLFSRKEGLVCSEPVATGKTNSDSRIALNTKAACTWGKHAEWLKGGEAAKARLTLSSHPQTFVALQDSNTNQNILSRLKDHVTHISVHAKNDDGYHESISVNLASLSKRTQLSVVSILFLRLCGRLTLQFIKKRAIVVEHSIQDFDHIVENAKIRALALGENPKEKVAHVRSVLNTALKSRRLAKGILIQRGGVCYIAYRDQQNRRFALMEKGGLLGEGSYGIVYEMLNLVTGEAQAAKFAKKSDKKGGIKNESLILTKLHQDSRVPGVQETPYAVVDLFDSEFNHGYFVKKYDYNLNDLNFLRATSAEVKLSSSLTLVQGLNRLHKANVVHGDIKPANCCSSNGELQLADFGHARETSRVTPEQPLGVCTPYFTCQTDKRENTRIALDYCLHQVAIGKVRNPLAKAWILQTAIEHPTYKIDKKAAKFTAAALLMSVKRERLTALKFATDLFKDEMELLKNNPKNIPIRMLDLRSFKLSENQLAQLGKDSISLCKGHDVFGLAVTLLCIYLGVRFISPRALDISLNKLGKMPEFKAVNPDLTKLLREMMNKDASKRPSISEVLGRYSALVGNLTSVKVAAKKKRKS